MKVPRLGGRPVYIAEYTAAKVSGVLSSAPLPEHDTQKAAIPLKNKERRLYNSFPEAGSNYEGGTSDGYCYRITFSGGKFGASFDLLRGFLQEEGYKNLPLPRDAEELLRFRLPPKLRHQLSIFGDNGYVHNPIKVLFPLTPGRRGELILEVYNEKHPEHLLRFHRR